MTHYTDPVPDHEEEEIVSRRRVERRTVEPGTESYEEHRVVDDGVVYDERHEVTTDPGVTYERRSVTADPGVTHERRTVVEPREAGPVHRVERRTTTNMVTARRSQAAFLVQVVWLLFGVLEALIAIRIVLKLVAANAGAGFASFVYGITDVFLAPFNALTATPSAGGAVLEISSIIAIVVYALLATLIAKVIWLIYDRPAAPPPV